MAHKIYTGKGGKWRHSGNRAWKVNELEIPMRSEDRYLSKQPKKIGKLWSEWNMWASSLRDEQFQIRHSPGYNDENGHQRQIGRKSLTMNWKKKHSYWRDWGVKSLEPMRLRDEPRQHIKIPSQKKGCYLEDRDQEDCPPTPAWVKSSRHPMVWTNG
jgi:hypothetical protein